jgi:hypothetical protein
MALKYQIIFKTRENHTCKVNFVIDGYSGSVIELQGADSPFILREFNTDEDLFKPLRPQQAEISFISQTNVTIDDFLGNSDEYCFIGFEFLSTTQYYWSGYLLQDDFQETWQDTKHIITLRATEGLGMLKNNPITDFDGDELRGRYTPYELLDYASNGSVLNFIRTHVISNLYHTTMDDTLSIPSIDQCYIDVKTFSTGDGFYEDAYTVLEKINSAFSQTMFQYKSRWYFLRLEELYIPNANNLRVININTLGTNNKTNERFDINVGVNEEVKPINPEMIRFINRPTKVDTVNVSYNYFTEILCNQNWKRGTLITSTSTYKTYTVDNWTAYKGLRETPTPVTVANYKKETLDIYGNITDSFLYLEYETTGTANSADWWQSCDIQVNKGDVLNLSFDWKWNETGVITSPIPTFNVAQVLYKADASPQFRAGLNNSGAWVLYPGDWDSLSSPNIPYLTVLPSDSSTTQNGYFNVSVQSLPIIRNGIVRILLHNTVALSYDNIWSNLQFTIDGTINGLLSDTISGDFDRYTKSENYKGNFEDEIYLDDLPNNNFKGTIYDESNSALTTPTWYRFRYDTEEFRFKKQNLIAHFENTRFYRNKIDATFYGLTWNDGTNPIGLINTIKFVDDDPNKIYYILNLKEINFSNSTWSATLIEVYDEDRDNGVETTYPTFTHDFIYR